MILTGPVLLYTGPKLLRFIEHRVAHKTKERGPLRSHIRHATMQVQNLLESLPSQGAVLSGEASTWPCEGGIAGGYDDHLLNRET